MNDKIWHLKEKVTIKGYRLKQISSTKFQSDKIIDKHMTEVFDGRCYVFLHPEMVKGSKWMKFHDLLRKIKGTW